MAKKDKAEELLKTLEDFTSKENWDKFFSIRGSDDSFEWYSEWASLRDPLISHLSCLHSPSGDAGAAAPEVSAASVQIMVPGCGNSRLSEHLYDAGFRSITNIDFSKIVISDMLRRNVRSRPGMRWRVMDMTSMQFMDESFDAVVDKGGLDALMEPELGPKLGSQYLSEVKRVLKSGGKFICLTLAESHVLGLLFPKFRFGWKTGLHAIPQKPSNKPSLLTFMVVIEKQRSSVVHQIACSFDQRSLDYNKNQGCGLLEALENENKVRSECSTGVDILYSLEDLQLGAKGDLKELIPGRRLQLTLGGVGVSRFSYKVVFLDAQQLPEPFLYHCGVFLVPKTRARDWLFSSEEGQWMVVESSKAARLIMVLLDASHSHASMDDIQKDLSPLVKSLAPAKNDNGAQIPFMMANDGVKQRSIVQQVTSALTGPIIVEDVIYENVNADGSGLFSSKDLMFRRLIFERSLGLVQSEALVITEGCPEKILAETELKKARSLSKSKKKGKSRNKLKVDHNYLASSYHTGIVSGFMLITSNLGSASLSGRSVRTVIVGLGAGLVPMFLRGCMPFLDIEVVELDPLILNVARDYFGFTEDNHLKVHIGDGIQFVREVAVKHEDESSSKIPEDGNEISKIDVLIIDADSSDPSSGITCPPADFVEESFLFSVKESLSEGGLFVINLVLRSPSIRETVVSRMKVVFDHLFSLQLEEDVNEVLFALTMETCMKEEFFPEAASQLHKLLHFTHPERGQSIIDTTKNIKCLK
ncbi:eEF1A lysine and N-terminal methyltransferase isoform X2 [Macadamia integrifolia]|uniref:eEF1A lysine and N-terminal methyltransferase isoform X2 n=1 Tax=Macadamia integrifolia TaxID=60698 RepID=UPI001C4E993B|nr:eEF1A lysine and N-terminal methyltransferase isoform X2 [Macadamia integrifolia]